MGSKQSSLETTSSTSSTEISADADCHSQKSQKKGNNLSGYALVEYKCRKKRARYEKCYHMNHSAFLTGSKLQVPVIVPVAEPVAAVGKKEDNGNTKSKNMMLEEQDCQDLFEAYKDCIYRGMLKDRQQRGLPIPKPQTALGDFCHEYDNHYGGS